MRPVLHDAPDKLGRQAMKRRPAALRATALAPGLRLRREEQGELVDVRAAVRLPPARVGNPLQVSAILIGEIKVAIIIIGESSTGAQEEGICAVTGKLHSRFEWRFRRKPDKIDPLSLRALTQELVSGAQLTSSESTRRDQLRS